MIETINKIIDLFVSIGKRFVFIVLVVAGLAALVFGVCAAGANFGPIGAILSLSLALAILIEVIKALLE